MKYRIWTSLIHEHPTILYIFAFVVSSNFFAKTQWHKSHTHTHTVAQQLWRFIKYHITYRTVLYTSVWMSRRVYMCTRYRKITFGGRKMNYIYIYTYQSGGRWSRTRNPFADCRPSPNLFLTLPPTPSNTPRGSFPHASFPLVALSTPSVSMSCDPTNSCLPPLKYNIYNDACVCIHTNARAHTHIHTHI